MEELQALFQLHVIPPKKDAACFTQNACFGQRKNSIAIRAVSTADYKTAASLISGKDFDAEILRCSATLIKENIKSADMVLYDIISKPPAAIEFE